MTIYNTDRTYPIKANFKKVIRINLGLPPNEQCLLLGGGGLLNTVKRTKDVPPYKINTVHWGNRCTVNRCTVPQTPFTHLNMRAVLNMCAVPNTVYRRAGIPT